MHTNQDIKTDFEIFENSLINKYSKSSIAVILVNKKQLLDFFDQNIYMKSSLFILVLNGSLLVEINFKKFLVEKDAIALLSFGHFFKLKHISDDFECIILYIGKDYINEMYSTDMIYRRVKYGVKMYSIPVLILNTENAELLAKRLGFVKQIIETTSHRYYKEMLLNTLSIFFLDLTNMIEQQYPISADQKISRDEIYFQKFLELLVDHYQQEHLVDYYAKELSITAHYLTLIIKRLTGQTVADFIFHLLYGEAKILLQQPDLSIQQIASSLNFSDQSSFGKFFKRKSGISPKAFRLKMLHT